MKSPIHERAFSGSLTAALGVVLQMVLQLVQVPILLHAWGREHYGVWLSLFAAFGICSSLDTGHLNYVGNLLNRYYVENRMLLQATLASALRMALLVGLVELALLGGAVFGGFAIPGLGSAKETAGVQVGLALLILMTNWVGLANPVSVVCRIWIPMGQFTRSQLWNLAARLTQFLSAIVVALAGGTVLGATVGWVAGALLLTVFFFRDLRRTTAEYFPWWRGGSLRMGAKNWFSSLWMTGNNVLDQFAGNGLSLAIAHQAGVGILPAFTTVRTLANLATTGTGVILAPLQADLVRFQVKGERDKIGATFAVVWFGLGTAIAITLLAMLPFVTGIFRYWTRGVLPFDFRLFATLGTAVALRGLGAPLQNYLFSTNQLSAQSWCGGVYALLTFGGASLLLPSMGLPGAGMSIAGAELVGSVGLPLWFVSREFRRHATAFPWAHFFRAAAGVVIVALLLAISAKDDAPRWLYAGGGLIGILAMAWWKWCTLENELRRRFLLLATRYVPWLCPAETAAIG